MFQWLDYDEKYAHLIDGWLDDEAVSLTGLDSGWDAYWNAVKEDAVNFPGCADFCKVIFEKSVPFAAVCYGVFQHVLTISEIVVAPGLRGTGKGTRLLVELMESARKYGPEKVNRVEAVIFSHNVASQKAFKKAGFRLDRKTEDDVDLIFTYQL